MNLPLFFARRYLVSKKSHNAINIISGISVFVVTIVTAALITVMSVFNGFEKLILSLFNSFDPSIKITLKEGKTFQSSLVPVDELKKLPGITAITEVLEENALLKYRDDKQYIATVKGVSSDFVTMTGLDTMMAGGELLLEEEEQDYAVAGSGVAYALSLNLEDYTSPIHLYVASRGKQMSLDPGDAFYQGQILPSGVFMVQQEFDSKYLIVPLRFLRKILHYTHEATALEIGLAPGTDDEAIRDQIKKIIGPSFHVKTRFEQHELLYKVIQSEKWAIYFILTFILIIAIFNVIGSLTMLILEKKKDIGILWSMGAPAISIRNIFLAEGILISAAGAFIGLLLGGTICFVQLQFGLVQLPQSGTFVIEAYPVAMKGMDFIYVFLTVMAIGLGAAWIPASQLVKKHLYSSTEL